MGQCAAINVIGHMGIDTQPNTESRFSPVMLSSFPSIMYLAIGKDAVSLGPDGSVASGEDIHQTFFGDDLGLGSKHMSHYSLFESADIMKGSIVSWSFVAQTIRRKEKEKFTWRDLSLIIRPIISINGKHIRITC